MCRRKKLINLTGWWLVNICRSYFPNCGYMLCIASKGSRLPVRKLQSRNYLLNQNESRLWMKPPSFQTRSADNTACSWTGRPSYSTCVHGGWIQQRCERDKENIFLIWIMWVDDGRNSSIHRFGCCEEWFHFHSQSCLISFFWTLTWQAALCLQSPALPGQRGTFISFLKSWHILLNHI